MSNIKIKGHESFYLREGWLRKGVCCIKDNEYILSDASKSVDILGVGSNMVKSIRYWLQAVGLTIEERGELGRRKQRLTKSFGEIIFEEDPYFEDIGTIFLLHYKLASNRELATSWYVFFNKINANEFTKTDVESAIKYDIFKDDSELKVSDKSIQDDCNCIIKTYSYEKSDLQNPEDNMVCPFSELGLLAKNNIKDRELLIEKLKPNKRKLSELIVLYVILDRLGDKKSVSINNLIEDDCNIGKIFNLDKNDINEYLDKLMDLGYLKITRTAGLNTVYPIVNSKDIESILRKYYKKN